MLKYEKFFRAFVVRRIGDFAKLFKLSQLTELPTSSVLHTLDNMNTPAGLSMVPRIDNPLAQLKPEKKRYVIASLEPHEHDLIRPDMTKMVVVQRGQSKALSEFRQANSRLVKLTDAPTDVPSAQAIIDYNALFNVRITGKYRGKRIMEMIMANVLNHIGRWKERNHIVHIPLQQAEYTRSDFQRAYATNATAPSLQNQTFSTLDD